MKSLLKPLSLILSVSLMHHSFGAFAESTAEFHFGLTFTPTTALDISVFPCQISGELGGEGAHNERWGLHERGGDSLHGVPTTEGDIIDTSGSEWGPNWGTQALVGKGSFKMVLLTEAMAAYPPSSYAWAKTFTSGLIAEVYNPTAFNQNLSFTVAHSLTVDVAAIAGPGEAAFAEAKWKLSLLGIKSGPAARNGAPGQLLSLEDHIWVSAELGSDYAPDTFNISSIFYTNDLEKIFLETLAPGERMQFRFDEANMYSHALAVPEASSVAWTLGMSGAFLIAILRKKLTLGRG